jgi:tetratricopeptide (TPR) repeat protein
VPEPASYTYRAFLSYSHRDSKWAAWLHKALEHTKIDKDLVGRTTPSGPVPANLRPIFRDRDDFSAGHSLTEQSIAALEGSQFLVAICSPNAARSIYVNEEIRYFKALGREGRVIPLIVDGEPNDPDRECFPPAIRFNLNPDGTIGTELQEPIAADAREVGDGKRMALIKITAGLLGVRLDEIIRRAERARRRQHRIWAATAAVFVALLGTGTGGVAWGYRKSLESDDWMDEVVRVASGFVSDATNLSDRLGVPVDVPLGLVTRADAALNSYIAKGKDSPKIRHRRALTLLSLAQNYEKLGQTDRRMDRAQEARSLLEHLVDLDARNPAWRHDLGIAHNAVADVLLTRGKVVDALAEYRKGLAIFTALSDELPANTDVKRELSVSYERIGDVLVDQGDFEGAAENVSKLVALREQLAKDKPADLDLQHDLAIAYSRAGEIAKRRGALDEATRQYRAALGINEKLSAAKPNNAVYLRDLGIAHDELASVLFSQSQIDAALAEYQAALTVRERLAASDPTNAIWQRDLSISHENIGNVHTVKGAYGEAVEAYRAAYAIKERLATADPTNTEAQRDQAVASSKIAYALALQGNTDEALKLYRANLAQREKLAASNPKNLVWQQDVSQTHEAIADLLVKRGAREEALEHFRKRLEIAEPIAKADASNAALRRQLGYTHMKMGDLFKALGQRKQAIASYRASVALRAPLAAANPNVAALALEMVFARWSLADLDDDAAGNLREIVATLQRLKAEGLLSPQAAGLLPDAEATLARLTGK